MITKKFSSFKCFLSTNILSATNIILKFKFGSSFSFSTLTTFTTFSAGSATLIAFSQTLSTSIAIRSSLWWKFSFTVFPKSTPSIKFSTIKTTSHTYTFTYTFSREKLKTRGKTIIKTSSSRSMLTRTLRTTSRTKSDISSRTTTSTRLFTSTFNTFCLIGFIILLTSTTFPARTIHIIEISIFPSFKFFAFLLTATVFAISTLRIMKFCIKSFTTTQTSSATTSLSFTLK